MFLAYLDFPNPFSSAKIFQDKFDVTVLHTKPEVAAQERMVDDGSGKVEVSSARAALALWALPAILEGRSVCLLCFFSSILIEASEQIGCPHNASGK